MIYTREYLYSLNSKVIFLDPMYGENKTRKNKKIIEIDNFFFYDVEHIKIDIEDVGIFISLLDGSNKVIVKRQLRQNESFSIIHNKMTNTYTYSFNI